MKDLMFCNFVTCRSLLWLLTSEELPNLQNYNEQIHAVCCPTYNFLYVAKQVQPLPKFYI